MRETAQWTSRDVGFSGKILDVFSIVGQGTFALVEDPVGTPRAGQRLEVLDKDTVLGTVVLSGLQQVERLAEGNVLALRFKSTGVQLQPGQLIRTPSVVQEEMRDDFARRLSAFAAGIGWATLAALILLVVLAAAQWVISATRLESLFGSQEFSHVESIRFTFWLTRLVIVMASIWVTSLIWIRRLQRFNSA